MSITNLKPTEVAKQTALEAVHLMGGTAFAVESGVLQPLVATLPATVYSGTSEIIGATYSRISRQMSGERTRIRHRIRAAMAAQAELEGRFLGGRPPYGYKLIDVGPHPNPAKAADGRRLHQLDLDSVAAPVVFRIFSEYDRSLDRGANAPLALPERGFTHLGESFGRGRSCG